jgi:Flp pilus assembly protein CpaB
MKIVPMKFLLGLLLGVAGGAPDCNASPGSSPEPHPVRRVSPGGSSSIVSKVPAAVRGVVVQIPVARSGLEGGPLVGGRVDLYWLGAEGQPGRTSSPKLIARNAPIAQVSQGEVKSGAPAMITLHLEVSGEEAQRITMAQSSGILSLQLRSFGELPKNGELSQQNVVTETRSITIAVSLTSGEPAQAGDTVDLYRETTLNGVRSVTKLVQGARIASLGRKSEGGLTTVTLDVSPSDAQKIASVGSADHLMMQLHRGSGTESSPEVSALSLKELVGQNEVKDDGRPTFRLRRAEDGEDEYEIVHGRAVKLDSTLKRLD